jgi:hypothetical protein
MLALGRRRDLIDQLDGGIDTTTAAGLIGYFTLEGLRAVLRDGLADERDHRPLPPITPCAGRIEDQAVIAVTGGGAC